jgi:hypothetical protein
MELEQKPTLDLLPANEPALSSTNDMPVIETKPDSQPAPKEEAKPEAKAEEVKAAPEEGKKSEESAPPETPEDDPAANAEPKDSPKAKGVQKRIDELVKQREEEKAEKLRLLAMLEQIQKPKPEEAKPTEDDAPARPLRTEFADNPNGYDEAMDKYIVELATYEANKAVKADRAEQEKQAHQRAIEQGQKAAQDAYKGRVEKAKEKYSDYQAVAESPDIVVSIPMAHAILQSEHGPDIAYHLGKNPAEAQRIAQLSPPVQLMEMGLIVARLTAPAAKPEVKEPAPQKPAVSAAPKPLKPLESKSDPASKAPQDMSMEEYAEYAKRRDAPKRAGART